MGFQEEIEEKDGKDGEKWGRGDRAEVPRKTAEPWGCAAPADEQGKAPAPSSLPASWTPLLSSPGPWDGGLFSSRTAGL